MALFGQEEPKEGARRGEIPVLVVEPNEEHQVLSTMALGRRGFRVIVAGTAREGLRLALSQPFAAIVLDAKVRDMPALEVLSVLAERLPDVPKIFVVSSGQESTAVRALAQGASGYLVKTARYNELLPSEVEAQIHAARARRSLKEQKKALGESEERFQKAFRASPVPIALTTKSDGRFIDVNDAFLHLLGAMRGEILGHTAAELDLYIEDETFARVQQEAAEAGSVRDTEVRMRTRNGETRVVSISIESIEIEGSTCHLTLARDVTDERRGERLRTALYEIADATESARDLPHLFRRIHEIVSELMPAENLYIALHDPVSDELSFPYFVDEKEPTPSPYKAGRGLTEYVLRTGTALLASPATFQGLVAQGLVETVGAEGVDWLGVPLTVSGRTIGVLAVQSYAETTRYTEREKEILTFVSSQVAMAIDRKAAQDALRRAEARFRTMFQDAPVGIVLVLTDGHIQETNPAFRRMLGYEAEELMGRTIADITFPEDIDESLRLLRSVARGERASFHLEKRYVRKDGRVIWGRLTATLLRSEDAAPAAVLGMIADVTEERTALEEREAASRRFHAMIDRISDGISLIGADGKITWQSPSATRIFGYSPEEVLGKAGFELVHPDDAAQLAPVFADLLATPGKNVTAEFRIRHKSGSWRWVEAIGTNLLKDPDLRTVVLNYRDITERNEALEQIRFQASLLEQVKNAVVATDRDFRIAYWNEAAVTMFGWRLPEVAGKRVQEVILAPESGENSEALVRLVREVGHWEGERSMLRKGGSRFPALVTLTALRDRHDTLVGYVGVLSDVTERVLARHELEVRVREQAAIAALGRKALVEPLLSSVLREAVETMARTLQVEFASVLELLPDERTLALKAKVGWDLAQDAPIANDPRATMVGYTLAVRTPVVMDDADHETRFGIPRLFTDRRILSGVTVLIPGPTRPYGVLTAHSTAKRKFGPDDIYFCESIANVIADALERNRIEKVLGANERMASMGQLAAYVAHEVNTPLTNISLLASSIARREKDPEILKKIRALGEQRRKASVIIADILEFPRQNVSHRVLEDVREVISAAVEHVGPFRKPDVDLVAETGNHAVFAQLDPVRIRDVFVTLLRNALEATTKGRVTVSLREWPDFVSVSVADTGVGMSPDALDRLFDPLASLKASTGPATLGLAVSRSIVAAHGGKIEAISEPGKGSTFTVILPRSEGP